MSGNSYTIGILLFARLSPILQILNLAGNGKCVKNWNLRDRGTGAERDEKTVEEKNRIVSWFHFIFILLFSSCCSTFTPSAALLSEYLEQREREMGWKGDIILPLESGVNCLPPEQNITDSLDFPTSCFPWIPLIQNHRVCRATCLPGVKPLRCRY